MRRPTRAVVSLVFAAALCGAGTDVALAEVDPIVALDAGNRLAAEGRWDEAITAYLDGWNPEAPHPTLAYNIGASYHQADQLPEAMLWYRRVSTDDPWVDENLMLARRSLGSQSLPLTGLAGWLRNHGEGLGLAAVLCAWLAFALVAVGGRKSGLVVATFALLLYVATEADRRWGPRHAILLEDCATAAGHLPAGTEAWVRSKEEGYRILGTEGATCPATTVALVEPTSG